MSAKRTIFPPGGPRQNTSHFAEDDEEMYTGHPHMESPPFPEPEEPPMQPRGPNRKGHAAYAAQDDLPPYTPNKAGFGGMFTGKESAFGPVQESGFRDDAKQAAGKEESFATPAEVLSVIPDDVLAEECAKRICPTCPAKKELTEAHLRAMADLENTKKRLTREKEEQTRFVAESVLNDIIPSLDNLDLALQHANTDAVCKNFVIGVQMTRKLMQDALAKHGLAQSGAVGEEFNPAIHEAVGMVDSPSQPDNHVCELLSNGYSLNGRLLRPARVMVCKKG
ncbi:nucleotide exchange factor GrpE [Desulfovibrio sp. OttesenSCG-928-G15]|nr:nucleotide exchange factor GrpE [Desulfovibrio sp. OttesenSCG-928-G15]